MNTRMQGLITATSLLILLSGDALASRYLEVPLDLSEATVINNAKRIIGRNLTDEPVVIEVTNADANADNLPDLVTTVLTLPLVDNLEINVTDINSTGTDAASEIITGWYVDLSGGKHGVIWRNVNNTYVHEVLPNYERVQQLCSGGTSRDSSADPPDCILTTTTAIQDALDKGASQGCDNSIWDGWTLETLPASTIATECDLENVANAVNDNGVIIGTSYKQNGDPRPTAWDELEESSDDPAVEPVIYYRAADLSIEINKDANAEPSPDDRTTRNGYIEQINRHGIEMAGRLWDADSGTYKKVIWQRPGGETGNNNPLVITREDGNAYPGTVEVTSLSPFGITGWYDTGNGQIKPGLWTLDRNSLDELYFDASDVKTFIEDKHYGRINQINDALEYVGVSINYPELPEEVETHRAFLSTLDCGPQDLNELLIEPKDTVSLENAISITTALQKNYILAVDEDDISPQYYVLEPSQLQVDLGVNIASDHPSLIVGEDHTYTITVENKMDPATAGAGDYATCVNVDIYPNIRIPDPDSEEGYFTKSGGLTIINAEAVGNVRCDWTPISVNCAIAKLVPGAQPITITLTTQPRPILAGREVRMTAIVRSTETQEFNASNPNCALFTEGDINCADNDSYVVTKIERQGCFIATAAYGSYLEPHVKTLRLFRDNYLMTSALGQSIVELYYDISPPIANYMYDRPHIKNLVRTLLTPVVWVIEAPMIALALIILASMLILRRRQRLVA